MQNNSIRLQYNMRMAFEKARKQKLLKAQQKIEKKYNLYRKTFIQASDIISIKSIIFYLLFMMLPVARCQDFTNNLILNGDFSQPKVMSKNQFFNFSILGWNCTNYCQLKDCDLGRKNWLNLHFVDSDCTGQVIDLNSDNFNEVVRQTVDLAAGKYLLHFNYFYPVRSSKKKQMKVTLNNQTLLHVWPQVDYSFDIFQYESQVQALEGPNVLAFRNIGLNDGTGFKINNVSLYRMVDTNLIDWLDILSQKASKVNTCPGFRVVFRSMLSFLVNFDRLQLYIYHNRKYSYNMQQMLVSINKLLDAKSNVAMGILDFLDKDAIQNNKALKEQIQFKEYYHSYPSFSNDYAGVSYLDNLNGSFVYFFPFVLTVVIIINIIFSLSFNSPISLAFRKYSLWAIALIMIFDGNIEALTFFTLTEFKTYFSSCFSHKILNVFIMFLFFLLVFIAFGLLHWGKFHYKKKVKFLLDEQKSNMAILWGIIIDRGMICFLFGVLHCTLLEFPFIQLILLTVLEISWVVKKLVYIRKGLYDEKYLVFASVLNGCSRVFFQISCLMYEYHSELRVSINQVVHAYLIYAIIGFSFFQFTIGCVYSFRDLLKICLARDNKISNHFQYQSRFIKKLSKGKSPRKQATYQQDKFETKKDHNQQKKQLKQQRQYKTVLRKWLFHPQQENTKDARFQRQRQHKKPAAAHITFQNELIVKTKRIRIRKYYQ